VNNNDISPRPLEKKDAPLMLEWMKDPEVNRFFRFNPERMSIGSVDAFIDNNITHHTTNEYNTVQYVNLAIVDDSDEYFGTVSLKNIDHDASNAEYAIALRTVAQRRGIGWTATAKILNLAFDTLGLERVYLNVLSNNESAIRFYNKFGFIYEGEFVNHLRLRGEFVSLKWYRILKAEWDNFNW